MMSEIEKEENLNQITPINTAFLSLKNESIQEIISTELRLVVLTKTNDSHRSNP